MKFKHIELSLFTSLSVADELTQITVSVLPLCSCAGFIVFSFSIFSCLSTNWIVSKPWLGLASGISASLCVVASFGFVMMCGVPYVDVVLSVPFLMLGIGIDDSFVLIACWRRTNSKNSVEQRMGETFSEAAVSITLTSVTNFLSFCVGIVTPFKITQIYSIYALTSILFCYIYEITFFGACLALSGYREKKKLHPLTFQPTVSKIEADSKNRLYTLFCYGDDSDKRSEIVWPMIFFRDYFSKLLTNKHSKSIVLFVFFTYLGCSIYGCYSIKEGMDYRNIFQYESYGWKYMDWHYRYFTDYPHRIQIIINKTLDYSNPVIQEKVENLLQKFENTSFSAGREFTESWLRIYKTVVKSPQGWLSFRGYNISNKQDFIEGLKIFFRFNIFEKLSTDVIFNENHTDIVATRFIVHSKNIRNSIQEKNMLIELYKIADESEFPVIIYSLLFPIIEQLLYVRDISIQTVASAAAIMVITFFAFIPNIKCALFVSFSVVSIEVGVIGLMSYWNVNLDALALMSLIMCVGFSVDFVSHISYAYLSCDYATSKEKIRYSLFSVGMPVVQGATSTILGIFFLILAKSYSFIIFFKIVFIVMILASIHALVVLPTLLSFTDNLYYFKAKNRPTATDLNTLEETEELNSLRKTESDIESKDTIQNNEDT
ncbi:patched domain-containing protein 3-like [Centruroides sculpturatus]|uniref:patched domain-containing protein 3-like n=1 Tax=Centruroides sculpturatus TaxID=218467 RepID=UPI000C6E5C19|nr:patched domain-containing protein 3-like [Centruroides sculpturatus]